MLRSGCTLIKGENPNESLLEEIGLAIEELATGCMVTHVETDYGENEALIVYLYYDEEIGDGEI